MEQDNAYLASICEETGSLSLPGTSKQVSEQIYEGKSEAEFGESGEEEEFEEAISRKRIRERCSSSESGECDGEWFEVRKGKKEKKLKMVEAFKSGNENCQLYITGKDPLPKQFALARFLKENEIKNVCRVKYISPFKVRIDFEDAKSADLLYKCENIVKNGWLTNKNETNFCFGLIRNVDFDLTDEKILENLTCEGKVVSAKRLMCRDRGNGQWRPCEVARLRFQGSKLPLHVYVEGLRIKVEPYVFPVSQCFKCWKIGHSVRNCPSNRFMCPKCGGSHDNCETKVFSCVNCKGNHMAMAKICPVYIKERRLRELMSEFACTYRKALTLYVTPAPFIDQDFANDCNEQHFPPLKEHISSISAEKAISESYSSILKNKNLFETHSVKSKIISPVQSKQKKEKMKELLEREKKKREKRQKEREEGSWRTRRCSIGGMYMRTVIRVRIKKKRRTIGKSHLES